MTRQRRTKRTSGAGTAHRDALTTALTEHRNPEAVLSVISATLPSGIGITDRDGKLVSVNDAYCAIYGYTAEAVIGQPFTIFLPEEGRAYALEMHQRFLTMGGEMPGEWRARRKDGSPIWILVASNRIYDEAGNPYRVSTVLDITERRTSEGEVAASRDRLAVLNRQKSRLFSIIAHDLKSPFNALLGFTELLSQAGEDLNPEQVRYYAGATNECGRQIFDLVGNLLDWARVQMEKTHCDPIALALRPTVDRILALYGRIADAKRITLVNRLPPLTAHADAAMTESILRNLLVNGIKFTAPGGRVEMSGDRIGDVIEIVVTDTGIGIPADYLAKLFFLAEQPASPDTDGRIGTGLGLVLCKELVERQGGCIRVVSAPGCGTTVRFTLPAVG